MKTLFYSTKDFELPYLKAAFLPGIEAAFIKTSLNHGTVIQAKGYDAVSVFTGDDVNGEVITYLKKLGVKYIAVRATGYDNVDIPAANEAGIGVANVPEYSPYSIAEHATAMMLALNRKLILADKQVHQQNFTLDKLVGFDLNKKKVGIIGTGHIGSVMAKIMHGFGCTVLAYDLKRNQTLENKYNVYYTGLHTLCSMCDIITLHLPLNETTRHLIDKKLLKSMKKGVMLINTSRGAIVDTEDLMEALITGHVGYYGMDVYEHEKDIFFHDHSAKGVNDPILQKLMGMPTVLITPHQAFATAEALQNIAAATFQNLSCWMKRRKVENEITYSGIIAKPV